MILTIQLLETPWNNIHIPQAIYKIIKKKFCVYQTSFCKIHQIFSQIILFSIPMPINNPCLQGFPACI